MGLRAVVTRAARSRRLTPLQWGVRVAGLPKSTVRDLLRSGTASGRTLAKLQKAGAVVADRRLIASLDAAS